MNNPSLSQTALKGVLWSSLERFGGRTINFIIAIFLYRLLTPEDFGTIALIAIFFSVSNILIDSGFSQALIREEKITEEDKSTVFYVNIIIAGIIFVALWYLAPSVSNFFEKPVLVDLLRFMALTPIFFSITIIQRTHFTHKINFRTQAYINLISATLSGLSAVILAFYGFGFWALALQQILLAFVASFLFWGLNPWIPKTFINKESFTKLFNFGSKLMLSGLINVGFLQGYKVIVGKLYSTTLLGFYSQAENLNNIVSQNLVSVFSRVTYPTLAKVKDDKKRLLEAYVKIIKVSSLVVFPASIGLFFIAEPAVVTLFGVKWINSVPIIQILAFSTLIYHLQVFNLDILKIFGRSDLFLKIEVIKKAGTAVAIIVGLQYGFFGLIILQAVSSYFSLFVNIYYTAKILGYSKIDQIKDILPIFYFSIPMLVVLYVINIIDIQSSIYHFMISLTVGVLIYVATLVLIKPKPFKDLIYLLRSKLPILNKLDLN